MRSSVGQEAVPLWPYTAAVLSKNIIHASADDSAERVEQLLLGSIISPQEASRLCAVQWANRLFPFSHVPARYICALAAGDVKLEIREEGQSGLKCPKAQPGKLACQER